MEPKFRAYNPATKEMLYSFEAPNLAAFFLGISLAPESILMQSTGLRDGSGVEIYVDDVLTLTNDKGVDISVLCQNGSVERSLLNFVGERHECLITGYHFLVGNRYPTYPIVKNYLGKCDLEIMQVIGNTHQRPELIKA